ncbi:MAG: hypothetical protein J4F37_13940 [Acidobacteria bacterium]|nr:hypothetical protein [Acidobacteriota bacterium]
MRIPSRIEWTGGAVLIGAAACSLLLLLGLVLLDVDQGIRVSGKVTRGDGVWRLEGPVSGRSLGLLGDARHVFAARGNRRVLLGEVRAVEARFHRSAEVILAAVEFESTAGGKGHPHPVREGPASLFVATRPPGPLLLALLEKVSPAR